MDHKMPWIAGLFALLLVVTTGCYGDPSHDAADDEGPGHPPANLHQWTTPDGNRVPYELAGNPQAEVTVVLVHCWMCDHTFWNDQLPALAATYRTLRFDLPGHGAATAERDPWTVAAYGEDVAGLIEHLGLGDVVLVGHSMGGPVSLRVAARLPGRVLGVVAVDTLHDAEFRFDGEEVEAMMQAFETDYAGTCNRFIEQMFPEQGVDEIVAEVRERSCDSRRGSVGAALMRSFSTIEMGAWLREAGVPVRAINAAQPHETKVETNRRYADFDAQLMEGVGHYPHMTRPEEFNERMLEVIAGLAAQEAGSEEGS